MGRASEDARNLALRDRATRECRKHLADLKNARAAPPPDVEPTFRDARGPRPSPVEMSSGATSPFALI